MYDVAIVGGGIVGCSTLFELTRHGFSCILIEKNHQLMSEASAGNSGMLHTGFDAPLESLEMECIKECQKKIFPVIDKLKIPFNKCGTILVAWNEQEKLEIPGLLHKTRQACLAHDICEISASELRQLEPCMRVGGQGALYVPQESVVDSWLLGVALAQHAVTQGAKILTNCKVFDSKDGCLNTSNGVIKATVTINCAGLFGDQVDQLHGINSFDIKPRKGQYSVFDKTAGHFFKSIIFPIPTEKSKGIALFKTVYGNAVCGPTAEDVLERSLPNFDPTTHLQLTLKAKELIPKLQDYTPVGHYMGVRPATQFKDYQITSYPERKWISVCGIRSTGVSAALGIAQYVSNKVIEDLHVDPSRGGSSGLNDLHWKVDTNRTSVIFDNKYVYEATHPIFLYGQQISECKL